MHTLKHTAAISSSMAESIILNACRANIARSKVSGSGYEVSFNQFGEEWRATVTCSNGFVIATSFVDISDR